MFGEQGKFLRKRKAKELEFQRDRFNSFYRWWYAEEKAKIYNNIKGGMALEKVLSQEWKTEGRQ